MRSQLLISLSIRVARYVVHIPWGESVSSKPRYVAGTPKATGDLTENGCCRYTTVTACAFRNITIDV